MSIQSKEIIYFEQTCRCCLAQGSGVEMLSMDATVLEIESSSTVADLLTECSFAENVIINMMMKYQLFVNDIV